MDTSNTWQKHVFFIKDDEVLEKYEQIWDVIKNKQGIKSHSQPKCLKAKVREFDGVIKTNFLGKRIMRIDKKNHSQVYLE